MDAFIVYEAAQKSEEEFLATIRKVIPIRVIDALYYLIERAEREGTANASQYSVTSRIANATQSFFGANAFATYYPWHYWMRRKKNVPHWGIYLHIDWLVAEAAAIKVSNKVVGNLSPLTVLRLLYLVAFRHELFHYHVERFAIHEEVKYKRNFYISYDRNVYDVTARTQDWLEEALAQAIVLESSFIANRVGMTRAQMKAILEPEFLKYPAGYKNFQCKHIAGGVEEAHKLLSAQVLTQKINSGLKVSDLALPKSEYNSDPSKVPGFLVWNPTSLYRFP